MRPARVRKLIVATALGGTLLAATAVPATASDAPPCRILGLEGVVDCVCTVLSLIGETGLPPGPQVCS